MFYLFKNLENDERFFVEANTEDEAWGVAGDYFELDEIEFISAEDEELALTSGYDVY